MRQRVAGTGLLIVALMAGASARTPGQGRAEIPDSSNIINGRVATGALAPAARMQGAPLAYRNASQKATQARAQIQELQQMAQRGVEPVALNYQWQRVRDSLQAMNQDQTAFMAQMTAQNRDRLREQVQYLEKARDQVEEKMLDLDQALLFGRMNKVAARAKDLDRAMQQWQDRHREFNGQLGSS